MMNCILISITCFSVDLVIEKNILYLGIHNYMKTLFALLEIPYSPVVLMTLRNTIDVYNIIFISDGQHYR